MNHSIKYIVVILLMVLVSACEKQIQLNRETDSYIHVFNELNGSITGIHLLDDQTILYTVMETASNGADYNNIFLGRYDEKSDNSWHQFIGKNEGFNGRITSLRDSTYLVSSNLGPKITRFKADGSILYSRNFSEFISNGTWVSKPVLDENNDVYISARNGAKAGVIYKLNHQGEGQLIASVGSTVPLPSSNIVLRSLVDFEVIHVQNGIAAVRCTCRPYLSGVDFYTNQVYLSINLTTAEILNWNWMTNRPHKPPIQYFEDEKTMGFSVRSISLNNHIYGVVGGPTFQLDPKYGSGYRSFRLQKLSLDMDSIWIKEFEFETDQLFLYDVMAMSNNSILVTGSNILNGIEKGFFMILNEDGEIVFEQYAVPKSTGFISAAESSNGSLHFGGSVLAWGQGTSQYQFKPMLIKTNRQREFASEQ